VPYLAILMLLLTAVFPQGRTIKPRGFVVLRGDYQVRAQGYNSYPITILPNAGSAVLKGNIQVLGAANYDVEVCVFDYANLENFMNRRPAYGLFCSGRVKIKAFEVPLDAGTYYLVINNLHSVLTEKWVRSWVVVDFPPTLPPQRQIRAPSVDKLITEIEETVYPKATYEKNKLVGLKKMAPEEIYEECKGSPLAETVVITEVQYKEEEIISFTVNRSTGQRKNVYFSSEVIHPFDRKNLFQLINENNKVKISGFLCGNGAEWNADEITLIK